MHHIQRFIVRNPKLDNVWDILQLISRPMRTENQLHKNPNIA